jgi:hypothetical protein
MSNGTNRIGLQIRLPEEFERLRAAYDPATMERSLCRAIAAGLDKANVIVLSTISRDRFNGVGPFPVAAQKLGHRSRRLVRSLSASRAVVKAPANLDVRTGLGSNVRYFGVHEFGHNGPVKVPAHDRELKDGRRVKVKAHERLLRMPARRPMRAGLGEQKNQETYLAFLWDEMKPVLLGT